MSFFQKYRASFWNLLTRNGFSSFTGFHAFFHVFPPFFTLSKLFSLFFSQFFQNLVFPLRLLPIFMLQNRRHNFKKTFGRLQRSSNTRSNRQTAGTDNHQSNKRCLRNRGLGQQHSQRRIYRQWRRRLRPHGHRVAAKNRAKHVSFDNSKSSHFNYS